MNGFMALLILLFFGYIGYSIGKSKEHGKLGFCLGFFLGILGWIIIWAWPQGTRAPKVNAYIRRCQGCGATVKTGSSCPFCGSDVFE